MANSALRLLTIGAVAVVMSGGLVTQTAHASTLDIDYLTPNVNNFGASLSSSEAIGQSFTPIASGQLTSVGVVIRRDTGSSGTLTIAVEGADSNKLPNGVRLATESVANTLIPNTQGEITVNFTTPTSVEAGNRYTVVLEADSSSQYSWFYAATAYPGDVWASKPGANWGSPQTTDTPTFGIYITTTQPAPAAEATTSPGAHIQQFGLPDGLTCQEAAPEELNWSGVAPGVGKTMIAVGLARNAVEAGYRTYFTTAADLAARCHRAAIGGRWATTMRFFAGPTLLVIDELGYLPLPAEATNALFQVISQRYMKTSIILTTNRGVGSWGEIFGDTTVAAMLDRLLHRSVVINLDGESYRLREHHARNEQLRHTTTGNRTPLQRPGHQVGKFNEQPRGLSTSAISV